jgi:hypothetical protein
MEFSSNTGIIFWQPCQVVNARHYQATRPLCMPSKGVGTRHWTGKDDLTRLFVGQTGGVTNARFLRFYFVHGNV